MTNSKSDLGNYKTERGDISPILSSIRKTYQNQVLESLSANDSLSDYENKQASNSFILDQREADLHFENKK